MPIFSYTATNATTRRKTKNMMVAETEAVVIEKMRLTGWTVTSTKPVVFGHTLNDKFEAMQGVPVVQKIFFTQNLGVMLRGGFAISRAMGTLAQQTTHSYFKKVILTIQSNLESGNSFSQSLKQFPNVFPELFINMISAGELSGKLDEVLHSLTVQMKKDFQLIAKVKGAMTYPVVVIVAMLGAGVAMIVYVVPKLKEVFESNNAKLPLPTRVLISISDGLIHYGIYVAAGVIALIIGTIFFAKTTTGKTMFDAIFLRTPILGAIIKKINLARFTRSLSSMLATDIPIIQTFQIISLTMSSMAFRKSMDEASVALKSGQTIAKILEQYPSLYPPLVQQMVNVGEESGTLDEVSQETKRR
jgi:type IV pilus assembly protein PilC